MVRVLDDNRSVRRIVYDEARPPYVRSSGGYPVGMSELDAFKFEVAHGVLLGTFYTKKVLQSRSDNGMQTSAASRRIENRAPAPGPPSPLRHALFLFLAVA